MTSMYRTVASLSAFISARRARSAGKAVHSAAATTVSPCPRAPPSHSAYKTASDRVKRSSTQPPSTTGMVDPTKENVTCWIRLHALRSHPLQFPGGPWCDRSTQLSSKWLLGVRRSRRNRTAGSSNRRTGSCGDFLCRIVICKPGSSAGSDRHSTKPCACISSRRLECSWTRRRRTRASTSLISRCAHCSGSVIHRYSSSSSPDKGSTPSQPSEARM